MAFAGMRGTGDWATDQRPFHWRKDLLRIFPQGKMPLTAITANMRSIAVDDPKFYSWRKVFPTQAADLTGSCVYKDATLSTAYAAADGYTTGQVVYCKMPLASVKEFRPRHYVLLRDSDSPSVDKHGEVISVVRDGDNSYIAVELLEDDNAASPDLSDVDRVLIIGNLNPEGAGAPTPIAYDPSSDYNYTQIWWNTLSQTGTAMATSLRTPDDFKEAQRDCWELHGIEIEKSGIYGERYEGVDPTTGRENRTTRGLVRGIQADSYAGTYNCLDFTTMTTVDDIDHDFSGNTWDQGGDIFLNLVLKRRARYANSSEALGFCGDGALLGVQQVVESNGMMSLERRQTDYGIEVRQWHSVFGTINIMTHPLFSHEPTDNFRMVIFEPAEVMFRPMRNRDTKYLKDPNFEKGGENAIDAKNEGYRTEGGFDFGNLRGGCVLDGIGKNNTQG